MLNIIYKLSPFIEDCYQEIGVREYSRIMKITAPTASKTLKDFESKGLLKKRLERRYLLFRADRNSEILKDLSRAYWREKLKELIENLNRIFHNPIIVLFGSLAKLETKQDSDIDLVVLSNIKKDISLEKFEKMYKREIQLFKFEAADKINKELKNNIINGYIIQGELK